MEPNLIQPNELPKTVQELTPRIVDDMIKGRIASTAYVASSGNRLIQPDHMLVIEWQGRRYLIPAFLQ